jgi:hypothetical protein
MNIQKIQAHGISVYRREFQASQNRTHGSRPTPIAADRPEQDTEFETELQKALDEGSETSSPRIQ